MEESAASLASHCIRIPHALLVSSIIGVNEWLRGTVNSMSRGLSCRLAQDNSVPGSGQTKHDFHGGPARGNGITVEESSS
jgi:hypothetical protein